MLGHYVTVAIRNFRRHWATTLIKVFALSLGLSCFVGAYMVSDYFDNTDGSWANAGRIYAIQQKIFLPGSSADIPTLPFDSPPAAKYIRADFPKLEAVARDLAYNGEYSVIAAGQKKALHMIQGVDPDFLRIFDLDFVQGDPARALSSPKSVIITTKAAESLFGTTKVLGRSINIQNLVDVTITGVINEIPPPSVLGTNFNTKHFELLATMDVTDDLIAPQFQNMSQNRYSEMDGWLNLGFRTFVLLPKDGSFTIDDLQKGLEDFGARHIPKEQGAGIFSAIPMSSITTATLDNIMLGGRLGLSITTILYFFGALVLGVACLDFANLATAEAAGRAKEIGMRKAIGASRLQVALQTLTEVAILMTVSLAIVLILMAILIAIVNNPTDIGLHLPPLARTGFWAGMLAILIVVSILAGGYPALVLARIRPVLALRIGKVRGGSRVVRALLIGAQFVAASFLICAVVVIFSQNAELKRTGLGRTEDPVVVVESSLINAKITAKTFRNEILSSPAVTGYTASGNQPFQLTGSLLDFSPSPDPAAKRISCQRRVVTFDYFSTVGIKLLAGRDFSEDRGDDRTQSQQPRKDLDLSQPGKLEELLKSQPPAPVVVDRATAEAFGWTPEQAIGKTFYEKIPPLPYLGNKEVTAPVTVIGVAENAPLEFMTIGTKNYVYQIQTAAAPFPLIRISKNNVSAGLKHIDEVWNRLAPDTPIKRRFLDEQFEDSFKTFNMVNTAFLSLAIFAVIIASLGLVGMATFIVGRRKREIGVRKTIGATTGQVLRMLLWDFSKPVLVANLIAWPLAFIMAQGYLSLFITRAPLTILPFAVSLVLTVLIAWAAVGTHAFRAARTNPANVLRYE
jgi:putative ABC transport system permease protein